LCKIMTDSYRYAAVMCGKVLLLSELVCDRRGFDYLAINQSINGFIYGEKFIASYSNDTDSDLVHRLMNV